MLLDFSSSNHNIHSYRSILSVFRSSVFVKGTIYNSIAGVYWKITSFALNIFVGIFFGYRVDIGMMSASFGLENFVNVLDIQFEFEF